MTPFAERSGWKILLYPAFRQKLQDLEETVAKLRDNDPDWRSHPRVKLLARLRDVMLDEIPTDPAHAKYEQGNTLGKHHRHWRRAKFLGRFRLFFRFHSASRTIVYAWVSDEQSLRKAGARSDPYHVFAASLLRGDPPDDWEDLRQACEDATRLTVTL